ncbi:MAG: hypothetical protein K8J08_07030 [Thermoanaerobaculia bacterium]|nr:hypothetical protein [Thermoanaerobaculia bacterium]
MRNLLLLLLLVPTALSAQDDLWEDDDWGDESEGVVWSGFLEAAYGTRLGDDPLLDEQDTLAEIRLRTEAEKPLGNASINWSGDVGYDAVEESWLLDVRDLSVAFSLGEKVEMRVGRQVQTWGTGDLVFLNDLFPKDFVSFFSGRDDEYLKAAADSVRLSAYLTKVNVDFVWTPAFSPNVYLTGERFSFFSNLAQAPVAPRPPLSAVDPARTFENGEFALRLFRTVQGRELALYGYHGFFKSPSALVENGGGDLTPTFAPMNSVGASLRQTAGPGLLNLELSYYDSIDDRDGRNGFLPNDQFRTLAGFEWEAQKNFTVGFQYSVEWTLDHTALLENSPAPTLEPDEFRHVLTNRLTYRSGLGKVTMSLFTFFSPSDEDYYFKPALAYRHSDRWSMTVGLNLLGGNEPQTFFGQLEDASNAYFRLRLSY